MSKREEIIWLYYKLFTFINERAAAVGFIFPKSVEQIVLTNWCGTTKINKSASFAASTNSGTATYKEFKLNICTNYSTYEVTQKRNNNNSKQCFGFWIRFMLVCLILKVQQLQ